MFSRLLKLFNKQTELRLLLIGNDATGKTSLLYRLKLGECVTTIPTIGFNVEEIEFPKLKASIVCWDVGGWYDFFFFFSFHFSILEYNVVFNHCCLLIVIKFDHYGDIIFKTLQASSSWWIPTTAIVWTAPTSKTSGRSPRRRACWRSLRSPNWLAGRFWCWPTSKISPA